jgi:hypothetical protein
MIVSQIKGLIQAGSALVLVQPIDRALRFRACLCGLTRSGIAKHGDGARKRGNPQAQLKQLSLAAWRATPISDWM